MSKTYPIDQQAVAIGVRQDIKVLYKARIEELEARVKELEAENKRLQQMNTRNRRISKENAVLRQQVKELSTDLVEAYDAVGILNKRVMDNERHVRRDS